MRRVFLLGMGVWSLTFAVFYGCLDNDFVNWDDAVVVFNNPSLQHFDLPSVLNLFSSFDWGSYVPLSRLSLMLDYAMWGNNPFGFHLTNLVLHAWNAALVFAIARWLMKEAAGSDLPVKKSLDLAAVIAALLYALHPLRVESVAWASERRDVLAGFFVLLTVLAYLGAVGSRTIHNRRAPLRRLAIGLFFCSLLSKANAVGLPLVLLFLDVHPLNRLRRGDPRPTRETIFRLVREKWLMLAGSLMAGVLAVYGQQHLGALASAQVLDWKTRLAISMIASARYLSKIIFPVHLSPYDYIHSDYFLSDPEIWIGLLGTTGLTVLFYRARHRGPAAWWSWLAYLVLIGPFLGILQVGHAVTADRYTYLAAIPLSIGIGALFLWLWNRTASPTRLHQGRLKFALIGRACGWLAAPAILIALALGTTRQILIWRNSESLWTHAVTVDPGNPFAWRSLAGALHLANKHEPALRCAQEAVHLLPEHAEHWHDLGAFYMTLDRCPEALAAYREAIKRSPGYQQAYHNMGLIHARLGDMAAALEDFSMAQKLEPSAATLFLIARCRDKQGDTAAAIQDYQAAAAGNIPEARIRWAELVTEKGGIHRALEILQEGLVRDPPPKLQIAFVETALAVPDPQPGEIKAARQTLRELSRHTRGESKKIADLQKRLDQRFGPDP